MKIIQSILFIALMISGSAVLAQKEVVEDTIIVEGICHMCKARIEEAAFGKGVKFVEWTNATSELAIVYRSDKVTREEIEKRIVTAGHSTENVKAERSDYESLPECCRYEHRHKH